MGARLRSGWAWCSRGCGWWALLPGSASASVAGGDRPGRTGRR